MEEERKKKLEDEETLLQYNPDIENNCTKKMSSKIS